MEWNHCGNLYKPRPKRTKDDVCSNRTSLRQLDVNGNKSTCFCRVSKHATYPILEPSRIAPSLNPIEPLWIKLSRSNNMALVRLVRNRTDSSRAQSQRNPSTPIESIRIEPNCSESDSQLEWRLAIAFSCDFSFLQQRRGILPQKSLNNRALYPFCQGFFCVLILFTRLRDCDRAPQALAWPRVNSDRDFQLQCKPARE